MKTQHEVLGSTFLEFARRHLLLEKTSNYIEYRLQSLSAVGNFLQDHRDALAGFFEMARPSVVGPAELGMNSPGILIDRLTILTVKKVHVTGSARVAEVDACIQNILTAIGSCRPAAALLLEKQTMLRDEFADFAEVSIHLLASNFRMWVSQDVLYSDSLELSSGYSVPDLVSLWGYENNFRNNCIRVIETLFR